MTQKPSSTLVNPIGVELQREFPILWEIVQQYDFAERIGGCTEPLWVEVDAAMRELWMARTNLLQQEGSE
jgi:hypothetical protein